MDDTAILSKGSGSAADGSSSSNSTTVAPASVSIGVSTPVLGVKLKQVKTKVTERIKKNPDGTETKCWDVQVGPPWCGFT